jgi:glycosyltransferase involved in cell wall biosynthesis
MKAVTTAVVVIGRNEGERLKRCLRSISSDVPTVYVDSGSTDGSVVFARSMGAHVIELDVTDGFTAARARNAGWRALPGLGFDAEYIQFVDGDCELNSDWLALAADVLRQEPDLAAVFGRRRERFPNRSIYNRMCDDEWNVPPGLVISCGGDVLMRRAALEQAGGYSDDLIAGEEPDLCLRLSHLGWKVRCIAAEMTLHDAAMTNIKQWWLRARRSGFAYMAHVLRHKDRAFPTWSRQVKSIFIWAGILPALALLSAVAGFVLQWPVLILLPLIILGLYGVQIIRVAWKKRSSGQDWLFALNFAILIIAGKFAEFGGLLRSMLDHVHKRRSVIIEYKE